MDIAKRFPENPILRPSDLRPGIDGMEIVCLLNPGVFRLGGRTGLLLRVAERPRQEEGRISFPIYNDRDEIEVLSFDKDDSRLDASDPRVIKYNGQNYLTTLSYLRPVFSDDGVHFYEDADYRPIYGKGPLESFGIEDCRVATMDDGYFLTFTEVSPVAVGVGLIATRDFKTLERKGMIFPPHNKDCALFESTVGGKYYAFHRPSSPELGGNYIWLAESPDRLHWGNHRCIAVTREGRWDSAPRGGRSRPRPYREGVARDIPWSRRQQPLLPRGAASRPRESCESACTERRAHHGTYGTLRKDGLLRKRRLHQRTVCGRGYDTHVLRGERRSHLRGHPLHP